MHKKTFTRFILVLAAALLLPVMFAEGQSAVLTINADKPVSKISPMLYGLMTEEINYSYDGGLYAEMVPQSHVPRATSRCAQQAAGGRW